MRSRILFDALVQDLREVAVANGYPVDLGTIYVNSFNPSTRVFPCCEVTGGAGSEQALDIGDRHTESEDAFRVRIWRTGDTAVEDLLDAKDAIRSAIRRGFLIALVSPAAGESRALRVEWEDMTDLDETVVEMPRSQVLTITVPYDFTVDGG